LRYENKTGELILQFYFPMDKRPIRNNPILRYAKQAVFADIKKQPHFHTSKQQTQKRFCVARQYCTDGACHLMAVMA
jgi:hypothetical protein